MKSQFVMRPFCVMYVVKLNQGKVEITVEQLFNHLRNLEVIKV